MAEESDEYVKNVLKERYKVVLQTLEDYAPAIEKMVEELYKTETITGEQVVEIIKKYDTPRLTEIVEDYDDIDIEDLIANEPMVVTITHRGYIKRVNLKSYEKQRLMSCLNL